MDSFLTYISFMMHFQYYYNFLAYVLYLYIYLIDYSKYICIFYSQFAHNNCNIAYIIIHYIHECI